MVKQGDIIKINFNPQQGHEQAGYRPAVVVSNNFFNAKTNFILACPITNTDNKFPLHIPLDDRMQTTGVVLCEQIKALDITTRPFKKVEEIPADILAQVVDVVYSQIEITSETDNS